jgi:cytochrome oxidase Cu insertion factor (SCO1/SenC/PrrC family)
VNRGRRTLLGLAALFLVPLGVAFALYYGSDWRPGRRTNHGELIVPARPLPAVSLRGADGAVLPPRLFHGKWSLVYLGSGRCPQACRQALYTMRQTRLELNQEMGRVQRVFLATGECCERALLATEYPGLITVDAADESAASVLREFPPAGPAPELFVVDPLGNLMLRFDLGLDQKGLLQDLKKLLTLSQIG